MKLVYISPLRYPGERAGSLFSVKSCEAFAREGIDTELWIPRRHNNVFEKDVFDHYGVKRNFKIKKFFAIDLIRFGLWGYKLLYISFALSVSVYVLWQKVFGKISEKIFYSHEQFALFGLTFLSKHTFYEVHDFPGSQKIYDLLFKRIHGVITTNRWKAEKLRERFNLPEEKILTVQNAVDVDKFSNTVSKLEARKNLGLTEEKYLIGYVGGLRTMGMEKGVGTAIDALKFLGEDYKLYVVGGEAPQDIEFYRNYAEDRGLADRVIFAGPVLHADVPVHMSACDSLVAPFPATEHYSYYMSPMKIFEYMATNRPIIVTDLPSLREVLIEGTTAIFVPPGDPQSLASAIQRLFLDPVLCQKLAQNASVEAASKYTWSSRAKLILDFLKKS